MINIIKAEFIKEKRGASSKLKFIVPIIFVIFNILMISIMGESPAGKSYIMATAFNWYPIMILPIVLSLLVANIVCKEKEEHKNFQKSINVRTESVLIAKSIVVVYEFFIILLLSSFLIYFLGVLLLKEEITLKAISLATFCLFIGSLPVIALSFLLLQLFNKKVVLILINFLFTFPSAVIAVTSNWIFFPWAYNLRILSPVIGVHPNGTFLETSSPMMQADVIYFGLLLSLTVYLFASILNIVIERRKSHV